MHNNITPPGKVSKNLKRDGHCLYRTRNEKSEEQIVAQQDAPLRYFLYCMRNGTSEDRIIAQ